VTGPGVDLGHDHVLYFERWAPVRGLNPQWSGFDDVDRFGATIEHPDPATGRVCAGFVTFAGDTQTVVSPRAPKWQVEQWDPLTLSPSVWCTCGDHGFVRDGRWVPA
jgi:hypothetical protein